MEKNRLSYRSIQFQRDQKDDAEDRTFRISFASDEEVEMWSGTQVLSHAPGAMVVGERQKSMPLLYNHDRDNVIGIVEKLEQDEHRSYATVRLAKSKDGDEALALIRDKVLVNCSFAYRVINEHYDTKREVYIADKWEPYEISLVTIPADPSVGVFRDLNQHLSIQKGVLNMDKTASKQQPAVKEEPRQIDEKALMTKAAAEERVRISTIDTMCRDFHINSETRQKLIDEGTNENAARAIVMNELKTRETKPAASSFRAAQNLDIGLTEKEKQNYSLVRAVNAYINGNWSKAGFEREVSEALAKSLNRESPGFFMPTDIPFASRRDYIAGSAANGGNLIATDLLVGSFIEALRNEAIVLKLGATFISGLVGNVEIPKQTGVATTKWIPEVGEVPKSNATFDKVALKMKTIAAKSFLSRNLIKQTSFAVENFVRQELIKSIALGIDAAALYGDGKSGNPTGIACQSGIHQLVGGENGAQITFDHLIDMETKVADSNADVSSMAYVANAVTIGALKKIKDDNKNYIWKPITDAVKNKIPGEVNGYPVARSNQVRKNLTKGTSEGICSEIYFGNWADLIIGEWGVVEILPNPYSDTAYDNGGVELRALQSLDIAVRHPESFCVFSDALTA